MSEVLCVTFRFIQPFSLFHGRTDAGAPEWPPSPMRAFQSLVSAAATRQRGKPLDSGVRSTLSVLESIRPQIVAPAAQATTVGYRAYVPHNQGDLVAAAWDRGNLDASMASHRMEKDVRPTRLICGEDILPAVHYLYPLTLPSVDRDRVLASIRPAVRSITALGWGIDQVVADAKLLSHSDIAALEGEVWRPAIGGGRSLRVHRAGSLDALEDRHHRFLRRLMNGSFTPVPPFSAMDVVSYRRDSDPAARPYAVFKLLDENEDTFRYPHARLVHIAAMVRHLAIELMKRDPPVWIGDPTKWIDTFVCGHCQNNAEHEQFSYVPLPSIGHGHADAMIRNVMLIAPLGANASLNTWPSGWMAKCCGRKALPAFKATCRSLARGKCS